MREKIVQPIVTFSAFVIKNIFHSFILFPDKFEEAKHFATKRRAFPPAVYNERRLNERPLPNTNRDNSDTEDDVQDLSEIVLFGTPLQTRAQSGAQTPGVSFVGYR